MIFETHAHYDDERFDEDREETIARVRAGGVSPIINVGASIESTRTTLALADNHDFIYAAAGVHPSDIDCLNEETFAWLTAQTANPKVVAVGEIGLAGCAGEPALLVQAPTGPGEGSISSGNHSLKRSRGGHHARNAGKPRG